MASIRDPTSPAPVGTSAGGPAAPSTARDKPAAGGPGDRRTRRGQPGDRFRAALAGSDVAAGPGPAASAAVLGSWIAEPGRPAAPARGAGTAATSTPRAIDRVLIGRASGGAEARIRIASGALAGSEIRLLVVAGRRSVEAELLTSAAGSRQTLVAAMDEIRRRLRGRGIALSTAGARRAPGAAREARRGAPAGQSP